jgi:hypothetical protein
MHTRVEALPDGSEHVAILHGPIVLAAKTGKQELTGLIADAGRSSHIAAGPYLPLERAPMLVGDRDSLAAHVHPVKGKPMVFKASTLIQPATFRDLELEPLFRTHDARLMVYWRTATQAAYPAVLDALGALERTRLVLEARTLDRVAPGEQQPEVEHAFKGEDTKTGMHLGRRWRDTARFITYQLRAAALDQPLELALTFSGADQNGGFQLFVGERELASIQLAGGRPDEFVELTFPVPRELVTASKGGIAVRLVAGRQRTSRLFELRLLKADSPAPARE